MGRNDSGERAMKVTKLKELPEDSKRNALYRLQFLIELRELMVTKGLELTHWERGTLPHMIGEVNKAIDIVLDAACNIDY